MLEIELPNNFTAFRFNFTGFALEFSGFNKFTSHKLHITSYVLEFACFNNSISGGDNSCGRKKFEFRGFCKFEESNFGLVWSFSG